MPVVHSKNALPTLGVLHLTIKFQVYSEPKDKYHIQEGNSYFNFDCRKNRKIMVNNAIYNAIKREFTGGSPVAYNIVILSYYYEYFFNHYEVIGKKNKKGETMLYERYTDIQTGKTKTYKEGLYVISDKSKNVGDYKPNMEEK
jgi:hypothetical protein